MRGQSFWRVGVYSSIARGRLRTLRGIPGKVIERLDAVGVGWGCYQRKAALAIMKEWGQDAVSVLD